MRWFLILTWDTLHCAWATHRTLGWPWSRSISVAVRNHCKLWTIRRYWQEQEKK